MFHVTLIVAKMLRDRNLLASSNATVVLQLSAAHFLQELPVYSHLLVFIQSSIALLFPLIDAGNRQSLRRVAYSALRWNGTLKGTKRFV